VTSILRDLSTNKLIEVSDEGLTLGRFRNEHETPYQITPYGRALAPFALPLRTCAAIIMYFLQPSTHIPYAGGLPEAYSYDDLQEEKYLLDILYRVCLMDNIQKMNFLQMPSKDNTNYGAMRNAIKKYFLVVSQQTGFWPNSPLAKFLEQPMDTLYETAAIRAIILLHWFRGDLPREIKTKTAVTLSLSIGDLDNLSEMSGYLIESISKCLPIRDEDTDGSNAKLMSAFRILSSRTKYGLTLDLVRIKNRHVSGVTRKSLILLSRDPVLNEYKNPVAFVQRATKEQWIKYFTPSQRDELLHTLDEPMIRGSVVSLAGKLLNDGLISESLKGILDSFLHASDWDEWERITKSLLNAINIDIKDTLYNGEYSFHMHSKNICFFFAQTEGDELLSIEDYQQFKGAVENDNYHKVIIVCKNGFESGILGSFAQKQKDRTLCIDSESFTGLVCQSICVGNGHGTDLFLRVLEDLSGEISRLNNNKLFGAVKNYSESETDNPRESDVTIYALFDNAGENEEIRSFKNACRKENLFCESIRWGENNLEFIQRVVKSGNPVFIYFYDDISIQSSFIRYQMEAIINNDLLNNDERKLLILWKNEEVKAVFEDKYSYFHNKGKIKGNSSLHDVVQMIKEVLEN